MATNLRDTVYRYYSGTLAAGQSIILEAQGDYIFLISNSGAANTLNVSFANTANQPLPVGLILRNNTIFDRITLENKDVAATTWVMAIGSGYIDYKALVISTAISIDPSKATSGTFAADVATGAAAQIVASNANVKAVLIQADFANTAPVYIGYDVTVSATKKIIALQPGDTYIVDRYSGALFAFSAAAQTVSVSYV